jgi:hypothetical protein
MHVLPNSWRFRPGRGLEFRGELVPAAGQLLHARLGTTETAITLVPDAALNMSSFDVTNLAADPVATPVITFVIRDAVTKDVVREFTFNWVELLGL